MGFQDRKPQNIGVQGEKDEIKVRPKDKMVDRTGTKVVNRDVAWKSELEDDESEK